jgi:hypothetical protein
VLRLDPDDTGARHNRDKAALEMSESDRGN